MVAVANNRSKIAVACFVLFCVALSLSAWSARNPAVTKWGVVFVAEALRPFQFLLKGTSGSVSGFWDNYIALINLRKDYESLQRRFSALEVENSRLLESDSEIKRLRLLLGLAEEKGLKGVAAEVIGYDPSNWNQIVTVDRGSSDGISRGMPVVQGDAAVGQVVAVASHSSRILLITDSTSGLDAIVQSSRARGVVEGDGHNLCELRYLSQEEEVSVGDRIVTSGLDGVFPKGMVIGVVSELNKRTSGMFQAVTVKPVVNFSRLETVLVVTNAPKIDPELEAQDKKTKKAR